MRYFELYILGGWGGGDMLRQIISPEHDALLPFLSSNFMANVPTLPLHPVFPGSHVAGAVLIPPGVALSPKSCLARTCPRGGCRAQQRSLLSSRRARERVWPAREVGRESGAGWSAPGGGASPPREAAMLGGVKTDSWSWGWGSSPVCN